MLSFSLSCHNSTKISLLDGYLLLGSHLGSEMLVEAFASNTLGSEPNKKFGSRICWWPNLDIDIEFFVQQCHTCQ